MARKSNGFTLALALAIAPACKKDGDKEDDAKAETKDEAKADEGGDEGEPTLQVAEGQEVVEGPVPPETSMVFYVVEGALLPLACFDKDAKKLQSGKACLDMVAEGTDVRVSSVDSAYDKKAGPLTEPGCMPGSGKKIAVSVEGIASGANYKFAAWPRSALKIVEWVPEDTTSPAATRLDDDEQAKLLAAVKSAGGGGDEVSAHQVGEIDVDGEGDPEKVYSVFIPHPSLPEQYAWSGIFLAHGGSLDDLVLLDKSKSKRYVIEVRGTLDIDGDGQQELWMRATSEEGAGDRIVDLEDGKAKPIGNWTCGM